jgi:RND family efflux transporter MFP subunit
MRIAGSIAAVVLVVLAAGCAREEAAPATVRPVVLAPVTLGSNGGLAVFAGEVKPRHEAELAFRVGGKLVERKVDVGAPVKEGQVLARLDASDLTLQAQSARAGLAAAKSEHTFAQAELARYQNLRRQNFVSASALEQKESAAHAAKARLDQAEAALEVTRNQAGYATLVAPHEGVITGVVAEAGQVVAAGQPVMKLARSGEREVAIAVPESRVGEVRDAQALAVMLLAQRDRRYPARVREIAPAVDPVTRTFAVRVSVPQADDTLAFGMSANVIVVGSGSGTSALVPSAAIYQRADGRPAVWVFDPAAGTVSLRAVELGTFREDGVVVTRGLADGEWVVAAGVNKLEEGQRVQPYEQPGKAAPVKVAPVPAAPIAAR